MGQEPSTYPVRSDSESSFEEEPEGDDLYAEEMLFQDYESHSDSDLSSENTSDANFIDSNTDISSADQEAAQSYIDDILNRRVNDRIIPSLEENTLGADLVSEPVSESEEEGIDGVGLFDANIESLEHRKKYRRQRDSKGIVGKLRNNKASRGVQLENPSKKSQEGEWEENFRRHVEDDNASDDFDWTTIRTNLSEWVQDLRVRQCIKYAVKNILWYHRNGDVHIYRQKLQSMARENRQSLEVEFLHLCSSHKAVIGKWLADVPADILPLLHDSVSDLMAVMFPLYSGRRPSTYVRIVGVMVKDSIRELRSVQLRSFVHVDGVIVRRSVVFKQLLSAIFECGICGMAVGPLVQNGPKEVRPVACTHCQSRGPFKLNTVQSTYKNHQIMALQESPGSVPAGRLPRTIELSVTEDLVDTAKPGDDVLVVGIFKHSYDPVLHHKQGFPVFLTTIDVNNITQSRAEFSGEVLDDEQELIRRLSNHPDVKHKLLRSVAPSIHGHSDVKLGLLLSLLGGVPKHRTGHRIRGDLNVLLLGDPGTGKSQFLKWVERTSHRAVFTTGKGSSAVGLTAAVHRDVVSGEYVLEGGAMVIADRGVCLIDEFDKMNDHDRTSIHEAMEQQTISVARAGIVTTLSARCTVIAAANPITGRYDSSTSLNENVQLTKPILSRFDLIFIICDEPSVEQDCMLGKFVTSSHRMNHPSASEEMHTDPTDGDDRVTFANGSPQNQDSTTLLTRETDLCEDSNPSTSLPLRQSLLKQYIYYARTKCHPRIVHTDPHRIPHLFAELRQESSITIRELESVLRLAEAHARIFLREFVLEEDFNAAIGLFLRCYLRRHKLGEQSHLFAKFRKYMVSDDKRWIPLVETRLRDMISREAAENGIDLNKQRFWEARKRATKLQKDRMESEHGRITIPFHRLAEVISRDNVSVATLRSILQRGSLLNSKVSLIGNSIVYNMDS